MAAVPGRPPRQCRLEGTGHVDVDSEQFRRRLYTIVSTMAAPQSPPWATNCVPEALHWHDPGPRDPGGIPAGRRSACLNTRSPVSTESPHGSVRCARAMGGWICQWIDDLHLLDDRAGPPVRDDHRQRIFMFRRSDEVNVQPVDFGMNSAGP